MDEFSGVDGSMALSDVYKNYSPSHRHNEAERYLRESVKGVAQRYSSFDSVDDLMRNEPLDIEYHVDGRGNIREIELTVATGGPGIYVELARGYVRGYWAGDEASLDIRNPRGTDWMFDFYAEMAPMNL